MLCDLTFEIRLNLQDLQLEKVLIFFPVQMNSFNLESIQGQ